MNNWKNQDTDRLCKALAGLKTVEECYAFLEDICTIKEVRDISQRLSVAWLLSKGESYQKIEADTGASSATISRVNKCYGYGTGAYKTVIERLNQEEEIKESEGGNEDADK